MDSAGKLILESILETKVFCQVCQIQRALSSHLADNQDNQNPGDHYEDSNPAGNPDHLCNALLQQLPKLMWIGSDAVYACRPTIRAARSENTGVIWPFAVFYRSPVCSAASL